MSLFSLVIAVALRTKEPLGIRIKVPTWFNDTTIQLNVRLIYNQSPKCFKAFSDFMQSLLTAFFLAVGLWGQASWKWCTNAFQCPAWYASVMLACTLDSVSNRDYPKLRLAESYHSCFIISSVTKSVQPHRHADFIPDVSAVPMQPRTSQVQKDSVI